MFGAPDFRFGSVVESPLDTTVALDPDLLEALLVVEATEGAKEGATEGATLEAPEKIVDASDLENVSSSPSVLAKDLVVPERIEKGLITSPPRFFSTEGTGCKGRLFPPDESVAICPENKDPSAAKPSASEGVEMILSSSSIRKSLLLALFFCLVLREGAGIAGLGTDDDERLLPPVAVPFVAPGFFFRTPGFGRVAAADGGASLDDVRRTSFLLLVLPAAILGLALVESVDLLLLLVGPSVITGKDCCCCDPTDARLMEAEAADTAEPLRATFAGKL